MKILAILERQGMMEEEEYPKSIGRTLQMPNESRQKWKPGN